MDGITHECAELLHKVNDECESTGSDELFPEPNIRASRNWLIRDGSYRLPKEPQCSTMKQTYPWPQKPDIRTRMGKRRTNILRQYTEEITKQLLEEKYEPPPTEKYCTTYDVSYYVDGFKPPEKSYGDTPELYEKYPLYSSSCMSYWQFLYENRHGKPGYAAIPDVKQPFKRRSTISKPLNEVLDEVKY